MKERILITVKTYPTLSAKHIETVCTGGINDRSEWRRIYPVEFRYLEGPQQYRLFDVVEMSLGPGVDTRPESRKPDRRTLKVIRHVRNWSARYDWVRPTIQSSLRSMIANGRTLAPVAVSEVLDFVAIKSADNWTEKQKAKLQQELLFDKRKPLEKIPWDFRLKWRDGDGTEHDSLYIAWEVFQTFRKYRREYQKPIEVMREKWMKDLCGPTRQVSFFMGNMARFRDNYLVCGIFSPPGKVVTDASLFE